MSRDRIPPGWRGIAIHADREVEPGIAEGTLKHGRADGPPEEAESDNPEEQARPILEESEDREKKSAEPSGGGEP